MGRRELLGTMETGTPPNSRVNSGRIDPCLSASVDPAQNPRPRLLDQYFAVRADLFGRIGHVSREDRGNIGNITTRTSAQQGERNY